MHSHQLSCTLINSREPSSTLNVIKLSMIIDERSFHAFVELLMPIATSRNKPDGNVNEDGTAAEILTSSFPFVQLIRFYLILREAV